MKSLRARLVVWYGLVLGLVLVLFGVTTTWGLWRLLLADVDRDLAAVADSLATVIERRPDGGYDLDFTDAQLAQLRGSPSVYYGFWGPDGGLIDRSARTVSLPARAVPGVGLRDGSREVIRTLAGDVSLLVGRDLQGERARLAQTARLLVLAGLAGLGVALAGAWFLAGRALAPIARIGDAAEAMSERNLGVRIDMAQTESELGGVAAALNQAFDRLQGAFDRQARFTADASHELRTPLASLMTEAEWALSRERSTVDYRAALATCLRAAWRMRAVVNGLLTLARADAGTPSAARAVVRLDAVAGELVQSLQASASGKQVTLTYHAVPVTVSGDPDRLRELVSNLVINAIEYNRPGGSVTVSLERVGTSARLLVEDTGIGIAADHLPHVFERFYRVDPTRARERGGAGLGLSIAAWIAEIHGGAISCSSQPGQGTRFWVELSADQSGVGPSAVAG